MKKLIPLLLAFALFSGCFAAAGGGEASAEAAVKDADVVISTADITSQARFYPAEIDGTKMEVIAVKAPDGTIRTAFNTCQVCYASGRGYYRQEEDVLVCQNCGNRFPMDKVEVESGGCNPVPIFDEYRATEGESIIIPLDLLKEATALFGNWKSGD